MLPPSTSAAPAPNEPTDTFGARCAKRACLENLIVMGVLQQVADLIDDERRKLIAAKKTDSSTPAPSKVEDFGDRKKIPPTPEQVAGYSAHIGYPLAGAEFCDFYAAKGWMVGKAKMKDWQAAVRNWKSSGWGHPLRPAKSTPGAGPRSAY